MLSFRSRAVIVAAVSNDLKLGDQQNAGVCGGSGH